MRNLKEKGFGLIGLLIAIAIIALIVFGGKSFFGRDKNQIEAGNDAVKQAEDAAKSEREHEIEIQNELNSSTDVNYQGVYDKLK
ncbi:MAG: hypothetical protein A3I07_01500 [Candidatus Doudnabacteria bacterium RIFCSPLOWO2_02_FULL_42_9]|uniref:Uncharacterized protein n=1 Tax=Candidatus Doudnabacteria bacterium RIFCSPHIGHO2_01_FULL_41_86 TaxID=1817821 RepID=A0A1F5N942_9BACT|nr:MAG: hypothetical protein A2717_01345 [Candidatus Doudnabacteria bacterium RIFCSPHIGHO2_01_FULL_41_86]OGE74870.1 MAG: hypothetical protein A3K07_02915 [Candidatus Doudnabacteria bacterium RIFCSPHIGHO2_01_43_10]OGE85215.1 MAG: hypothetical protein A3E28_00910 [Candidatus Doudnabacteria bacterium RIFCSPHIGHO2_12_FULL_42_22]OGE86753.1 MAG: hypothetical protein A3C49_01745 [Candidatus Doudnabacteria bacterium RIFCSPHIGHO2_02_FULL_42_25]OGE92351.1 MAG: hypothetical protein A2895_01900 [Candidatus